jgi:hypothetical protein
MIFPTEDEILERIKDNKIPDPKRLQRIRLDSVGKVNPAEESNKKHYPQRYEKTKRLVQIPPEDLMRVYSLSFPLSLTGGEFYDRQHGQPLIYDSFYRWEGGDCVNKGSMHLTTAKGLNELVKIFTRHDLEVRVAAAYGPVFDLSHFNNPGVCVYHSFSNHDHDNLTQNQFVPCEMPVIAIPYWYVIERALEKQKKREHTMKIVKLNDSLTLTSCLIQERKYCTGAFFIWPEYHEFADHPDGKKLIEQNVLPKLQANAQKEMKESNESKDRVRTHHDEMTDTEVKASNARLLKVGEPVKIFDPEWVKV